LPVLVSWLAASLTEGECIKGISPLPGMAAVTWSMFIPRPGSRVTDRNSGLLPLPVAFRESVNTSSPPTWLAAGVAGCGDGSVGGCCRQPAASKVNPARSVPNRLFLLSINVSSPHFAIASLP
jgi:hypothetical protein